MKLVNTKQSETHIAMGIIDTAKKHLKEQGIDQWQNGYPDLDCIKADTQNGKGFFVKDGEDILAYLCIDLGGEPAYNSLKGEWLSEEKYVVVHRMAMSDKARGKNLSGTIFGLVESFAKEKGVHYFRVDTDSDNLKMRHVLEKNGFSYRGTIWFDNSEKIAFDKMIL